MPYRAGHCADGRGTEAQTAQECDRKIGSRVRVVARKAFADIVQPGGEQSLARRAEIAGDFFCPSLVAIGRKNRTSIR